MKKMIPLLKEVKKAFDAYNIPFWLEGGTLLGAIRDGKVIPWDDDIDLAAFYDEAFREIGNISKYFFNLGFDVFNSRTKISFRKKDVSLSIFLYDHGDYIKRAKVTRKNKLVKNFYYSFMQGLIAPHRDYIHKMSLRQRLIQITKNIMMSLPGKQQIYELLLRFWDKTGLLIVYDINVSSDCVKKFKRINFCDIKVNVPIKSEKYLEHFYGKEWRIPDENWSQNDQVRRMKKLQKELNSKKKQNNK